MFHASKCLFSVSRKCSLALLPLLAPLAQASVILPEQIRIDINSVPEQINFDFKLDFGTSSPSTSVEMIFLGVFFATYASEGSEPWFNVGYVQHAPEETAHDLNATLRMFLFEEGFDGQTYNFINRVSLKDTYVFAFEGEAYYIPNDCVQFEDDCPPPMAAYSREETLVTFYDSGDGTDNPGPGNPTEVSLPGSLPLAMIAALGVFWRSRAEG